MTLYDCATYKEAIKHLIQDRKTKKRSVTFEAMSKHCGIQKTYLSKVLNKDGNLSLDQLYLANDYLKLSSFESQYLEQLYLHNTTQIAARKQRAEIFLEKAKKENLKSENSIQVENEILMHQIMKEKYYLDSFYQLIHMFLTIDTFIRNPQDISKKLNLSKAKFELYLQDLISWKMIEFKNGSYKVLKNNIHLSKDSYLNSAFRNFSRIASQSKMNELNEDQFYSFSAVISCDEPTKQKIQKKFLEFLKQCQSDVMKSSTTDVYQINFDLLKWS